MPHTTCSKDSNPPSTLACISLSLQDEPSSFQDIILLCCSTNFQYSFNSALQTISQLRFDWLPLQILFDIWPCIFRLTVLNWSQKQEWWAQSIRQMGRCHFLWYLPNKVKFHLQCLESLRSSIDFLVLSGVAWFDTLCSIWLAAASELCPCTSNISHQLA